MPEAKREIDKIVALFGSQKALAKALKLTPSAVNKWVKRGYIPTGQIENLRRLIDEFGRCLTQDINLEKSTYVWSIVKLCPIKECPLKKNMT